MSQDLVKALGVPVSSAEHIAASLRCGAPIHNEYVSVVSLRAALEKLPVVEGKITFVGTPDNKESYAKFEVVDKPHRTHTARLFAIEEIEKEPLVEKFVQLIPESNLANLMIRKNFAGKRVKITVEEIVGE